MIGNLFDTESYSDKSSFFKPISNKAKKRYIADDLELPPIKRQPGEFSGVVNQTATCYLNALFQSLYYTPELRKMIFSVDLENLTAYEKGSGKYKLIKEFQLFFGRLKYLSFKNHYTNVCSVQ